MQVAQVPSADADFQIVEREMPRQAQDRLPRGWWTGSQ
jgi:hypothetical protein